MGRYSTVRLSTSKNTLNAVEEPQYVKKHKMEFWKDNECTRTLMFGYRTEDVCVECGEGGAFIGHNAGKCSFCGETCHYKCQCPLGECTVEKDHCENCCPCIRLMMAQLDSQHAEQHPQEGEVRVYLSQFLQGFSPQWKNIFHQTQRNVGPVATQLQEPMEA